MGKAKTLAKKLTLATETVRVLDADELDGAAGGGGPLSWFGPCVSNGETADCRSAMGGRCDSTTPDGEPGKDRPWSIFGACVSGYGGYCKSAGGDCRTK